MTTRDEIIDALERKRGDAAPPAIFTQTGTVGQMDACGACWPEANFDVEKMVTLALQPAEMFGFATVKIPFDITIIPEIMGCEIQEGKKDSQPAVSGSEWRNDDMMVPEVPDIISPDEFLASGRCPLMLDAASKIRSRREDLFLVTGMEDAFSTAYQMVGLETFLVGAMMDPDLCGRWVRAIVPCLDAYAKALSEVSDDVQIIIEASADVAPPEMFDMFTKDSASEIISNVKGSYSTVHCCGDTTDVMAGIASMGEDGLSVESFLDYDGVMERIGDKVAVIGGIPPVDHLMNGTPDVIVADAWKASDAGYSIIAPECGVPPHTPDENLQALAGYRSRR
ncbi:MAG: hypothetical protein IKQ60_03045 [Candidatus Methanomethylophilaceae archaeon]|nr:hypothetical protein [Candidatus Methanomethylophilaceae archaeon]